MFGGVCEKQSIPNGNCRFSSHIHGSMVILPAANIEKSCRRSSDTTHHIGTPSTWLSVL